MKVTNLTAALILASTVFTGNALANSSDDFIAIQGGERTASVTTGSSDKANVDKSLAIFMKVLTNDHARLTSPTYALNLTAGADSYTKQFTG
jgi:hypothetical protein